MYWLDKVIAMGPTSVCVCVHVMGQWLMEFPLCNSENCFFFLRVFIFRSTTSAQSGRKPGESSHPLSSRETARFGLFSSRSSFCSTARPPLNGRVSLFCAFDSSRKSSKDFRVTWWSNVAFSSFVAFASVNSTRVSCRGKVEGEHKIKRCEAKSHMDGHVSAGAYWSRFLACSIEMMSLPFQVFRLSPSFSLPPSPSFACSRQFSRSRLSEFRKRLGVGLVRLRSKLYSPIARILRLAPSCTECTLS